MSIELRKITAEGSWCSTRKRDVRSRWIRMWAHMSNETTSAIYLALIVGLFYGAAITFALMR